MQKLQLKYNSDTKKFGLYDAYNDEVKLKATKIAIGNFDGLHKGHQAILRELINLNCDNELPLQTAIVTFSPHTYIYFKNKREQNNSSIHYLLTTDEEKASLIAKTSFKHNYNIDYIIFIHFDEFIEKLSPDSFINEIIYNLLHAKGLITGEDFCFAKNRQGNAELLAKYSINLGFKYKALPKIYEYNNSEKISSSTIRKYLENGDIDKANNLLAENFSISGEVISGNKIGTNIGFATANIALPKHKIIPRFGVYAVRIKLYNKGNTTTDEYYAACNIGTKPSVNDGNTLANIECFIFDFKEDIYGQKITVILDKFIRDEQKFNNLEDLKTQIAKDVAKIQDFYYL